MRRLRVWAGRNPDQSQSCQRPIPHDHADRGGRFRFVVGFGAPRVLQNRLMRGEDQLARNDTRSSPGDYLRLSIRLKRRRCKLRSLNSRTTGKTLYERTCSIHIAKGFAHRPSAARHRAQLVERDGWRSPSGDPVFTSFRFRPTRDLRVYGIQSQYWRGQRQ